MTAKELIEKNYIGKKGKTYHQSKHSVSPRVFEWISNSRAKRFQNYIQASDKVLEFGVGAGWNLVQLRASEKVGFDIYRMKSNFEKFSIIFHDDMEKIKNNHFDVVICAHVLEHVPDPVESLKLIRSKLKVGGKFILVLPWEREKKYRKYNPKDDNSHIFSWNAQTITNLLKFNNYKIGMASIANYGYDRWSGRLAEKFHLGEVGYKFIRRFLRSIRPVKEFVIIANK